MNAIKRGTKMIFYYDCNTEMEPTDNFKRVKGTYGYGRVWKCPKCGCTELD